MGKRGQALALLLSVALLAACGRSRQDTSHSVETEAYTLRVEGERLLTQQTLPADSTVGDTLGRLLPLGYDTVYTATRAVPRVTERRPYRSYSSTWFSSFDKVLNRF